MMQKLTGVLLLSSALLTGACWAAAEQTVGKQVGSVLKDSAEKMSTQQFSAASAALKTALQIQGLSDFERFSIHRLLVGAAQGDRQHSQVIDSGRHVLASPFLAETERASIANSQMNAYLRSNQFIQAADLAEQRLNQNPGDIALMEVRLKANYLAKRFDASMKNGEDLLSALRQQRKKPAQEVLKIYAASAVEVNNEPQYEKALNGLVAHYPSAEYWSDLLYRAQAANAFAKTGEIHFYRLLSTVGAFRDPGEFLDAAEAAIKLGFPLEAQRYLDQAVKQGLLPNAALKFQYDDKRKQTEKMIQQDAQASLKAVAAKTPAAASANGFNALLQGNSEAGLKAMRTAVDQAGSAAPLLRLNHGVALTWAGQVPQASVEFNKLTDDPTSASVAKLWLLFINPDGLE